MRPARTSMPPAVIGENFGTRREPADNAIPDRAIQRERMDEREFRRTLRRRQVARIGDGATIGSGKASLFNRHLAQPFSRRSSWLSFYVLTAQRLSSVTV